MLVERPELSRRESRHAMKQDREVAVARAPDAIRYLGNRQIGLAQQRLGDFDASFDDITVWRDTRCFPKSVREMSGTQSDCIGECRKRDGTAQVLVDVLDRPA